MDAVLFGGSTVTLQIWVQQASNASATFTNISVLTAVASGAFAIVAAPETGGLSLIPWAAYMSGVTATVSGLTAGAAAWTADDPANPYSAARAECFGGLRIQDLHGLDSAGLLPLVDPGPGGGAHLQGPDNALNTLQTPDSSGTARRRLLEAMCMLNTTRAFFRRG